MKRQVPLALCFLFGIVMILTQFVPHKYVQALYKEFIDWGLIISPFALVLAVITLIQTHTTRVRRRTEHWQYSFLVFAGMIIMVCVGVPFGEQDSVFVWLYDNVQVPMDATMFSLLAFFIASAAFRAFRARSFEATLLLVTAMIVMLGNIPIGDLVWNKVMSWTPWADGASGARQWILDVLNSAARRGIILGVSLGVISQSIRIILGIERSYLGGGD
ncbi:hypothetical protein F4009_16325 [Candidatus Poribacteria bacterium]|nr:hypothetical protein [Candidatus Poribacteria bacterium]MYA70225.1 hypothetical protein [Candidatus Poribacteria bacterium]MYH83669.1 hypothetical protein [Candidatus Poribacteria bacterium]MYK95537.1 hypothetical protein [Candidatus Poribacteria bacterium]